MGKGKLAFFADDLTANLEPTFLRPADWTSPGTREVAEHIIAWATGRSLKFRVGSGLKYVTQYIVAPPPLGHQARQGAPFLTLYQGRPHPPQNAIGPIHFNFSRLTELGFTDRAAEPTLLRDLNASLPKGFAIPATCLSPDNNGKYWGSIPYKALSSAPARLAFTSFVVRFLSGLAW